MYNRSLKGLFLLSAVVVSISAAAANVSYSSKFSIPKKSSSTIKLTTGNVYNKITLSKVNYTRLKSLLGTS